MPGLFSCSAPSSPLQSGCVFHPSPCPLEGRGGAEALQEFGPMGLGKALPAEAQRSGPGASRALHGLELFPLSLEQAEGTGTLQVTPLAWPEQVLLLAGVQPHLRLLGRKRGFFSLLNWRSHKRALPTPTFYLFGVFEGSEALLCLDLLCHFMC